VAQVEDTYWDYALAARAMEIVTNALHLAEQQVTETKERIQVGAVAETELAAVEAELARRQENLIDANILLAQTRLRLLQLLNPADMGSWQREIIVRSAPEAPNITLDDVDTYVHVAMRMRPELNQARLGIQRDDLELVKTRNGLLPQLDLFITLGGTGYASSFGRSFSGGTGDDGYDLLVGVSAEYPPANRAARARHGRAVYSRQQAWRAVQNLEQLAEVDVRSAYIEVTRSREQVTATAATERLQEETLRVETEKFRVGKSTNFLVAQAQRDLLQSQIDQVQATANYLKAIIALHLQEGALLERRGIVAPGASPVSLPQRTGP
jgi:outer membrane protein